MQPQDFIAYVVTADEELYKAIKSAVSIGCQEHIWGQLKAIDEWEDVCQEVEDNSFPLYPLTQGEQARLELICGAIYNLFPPKEVCI